MECGLLSIVRWVRIYEKRIVVMTSPEVKTMKKIRVSVDSERRQGQGGSCVAWLKGSRREETMRKFSSSLVTNNQQKKIKKYEGMRRNSDGK